MILEGDLFVATCWPWDRYRHVLDIPHIVTGDIESRAAGEWVLDDDAVLTGETVLPQFSADAISPKLTPKASPRAMTPGRGSAPRRSGGRPKSRRRPPPNHGG